MSEAMRTPGTCPEHARICEKLQEIGEDVKMILKRQQEEDVASASGAAKNEGRLVHLEAVVLGSKDCENGTTRIDKIITSLKVMADRMKTVERIVYGGVGIVLLTVVGLVLTRVLGK